MSRPILECRSIVLGDVVGQPDERRSQEDTKEGFCEGGLSNIRWADVAGASE